MPGGTIATGETSLEALKRELEEEIHGKYEIEQPSLSAESIFSVGAKRHQQYCIYYEVSWPGSPGELVGRSHEEFRWVKICDLGSYVLKPDYISSVLSSKPVALQHVAFRDAEHDGAPEAPADGGDP